MTVLREDRERYLNDANFHALAHLIVLAFERHPNAAQMDAGDVTAAARCAEEILWDRQYERRTQESPGGWSYQLPEKHDPPHGAPQFMPSAPQGFAADADPPYGDDRGPDDAD